MLSISPLRRHLTPLLLAAALLCPCTATGQQTTTTTAPWWQHAVLYEIYPRSFQDSNGDGTGDLNGITARLDYLQHLGIDAIWLAPMYPSPQVDFGYDISNYEAIDPQYGTLADFDRLLAAARAHHIRIILDMVLNHTSSQHPWFLESASSRTNPHADWYVWNDGVAPNAPGVTDYQRRFIHQGPHGPVVPPTNWVSNFGGSAWEWNPTRGQFYYHAFYTAQPDLNWNNPAVEKAMFAAMKFWLDRGVAGFRLDAIGALFEDPQLRNNPETSGVNATGDPNEHNLYAGGFPQVHGVVQRLRTLVDSYPGNRVLIGETYTGNTAQLRVWYGTPAHPEFQLPMDTLIGFHNDAGAPAFNVAHFRKYLSESQADLNNHVPLIVVDNHDNPRSWDRFTTPSETPAQKLAIAKIIATLLFTTRDVSLMYYGEELGMTTETPTRKQNVRDPIGITGWPREKGRDGERTPMQWTAGPQAGFSIDPNTWLPIPPDHATINVVDESKDPNSLLQWHEKLIALRRDNPAIHDGATTFLDNQNPNVLTYRRNSANNSSFVLISVNMTGKPQQVTLDETSAPHAARWTTLLTDAPTLEHTKSPQTFTLPPFASVIAEIQQQP